MHFQVVHGFRAFGQFFIKIILKTFVAEVLIITVYETDALSLLS